MYFVLHKPNITVELRVHQRRFQSMALADLDSIAKMGITRDRQLATGGEGKGSMASTLTHATELGDRSWVVADGDRDSRPRQIKDIGSCGVSWRDKLGIAHVVSRISADAGLEYIEN